MDIMSNLVLKKEESWKKVSIMLENTFVIMNSMLVEIETLGVLWWDLKWIWETLY